MNETYTFEQRDGRWAMVERRRPDRYEWISVKITFERYDGETHVFVALCEERDSHLLGSGLDDAVAVRASMAITLGYNYLLKVPTDFDDEEDWSTSEQLAEKFREQFLGGDFTPFRNGVFIRWFSLDGLNTIALGEGYSFWHVDIFLPELLRQMLAACSTHNERQIILDGHFYLVRPIGDWSAGCGDPVIVEAKALLSDAVRQAA